MKSLIAALATRGSRDRDVTTNRRYYYTYILYSKLLLLSSYHDIIKLPATELLIIMMMLVASPWTSQDSELGLLIRDDLVAKCKRMDVGSSLCL